MDAYRPISILVGLLTTYMISYSMQSADSSDEPVYANECVLSRALRAVCLRVGGVGLSGSLVKGAASEGVLAKVPVRHLRGQLVGQG